MTHGHFDHMMGLDGFLKEYDVPVYVEEEDEEVLQDPRLNLSATYTEGMYLRRQRRCKMERSSPLQDMNFG